ncbi:hypothetical protein [Labilithrix luteola]|nr:hypothetical protein [Labilithrix luteola]
MQLRSLVSLGTTVFVALVVACNSGLVDHEGSCPSGSTCEGSDDGGANVDSGTEGEHCTIGSLPGDRACVPGFGKAGTPITIAAEGEGCLGCFTAFEACKVDVAGTNITITMATKTCPPAGDRACPAICAIPKTTCTLPALAAGEYRVQFSNESKGVRWRTLVVAADGDTSCDLTQPGLPPAELDTTKYSKTCTTDEDCVAVASGSTCGACGVCPSTAIAKTDETAYDAEVRRLTSQCSFPDEVPACAPCPPAEARCQAGACVLSK